MGPLSENLGAVVTDDCAAGLISRFVEEDTSIGARGACATGMTGSVIDTVVEPEVVVGVSGTCATEVAGLLVNTIGECEISVRAEGTGATIVTGFVVIGALRSIDLGMGR